jgi:hypothetical protein
LYRPDGPHSILARVGLSKLARVRSIHDIVIVKEE